MTRYRVIGLMSGTSLDGVDAALIETDGESEIRRVAFDTRPYDEETRAKIRRVLGQKSMQSLEVKEAEDVLTRLHANIVNDMVARHGKVDLIGFHGQTIHHAPEKGETCQIGDGALLASMTGVEVVNDFRTADVTAGGQGAPLVPVYHQALAATLQKPVVFLNIGGVANVTYVGGDGELLAFDTGPGNALVDDWMLKKTGRPYDADGKAAAAGGADDLVLKRFLAHPFFEAPAPKSLDRNAFADIGADHLSAEDGAATLSLCTVHAIAAAEKLFPASAKKWIVCGGGRLNSFLMTKIKELVNAEVSSIDKLGLNGDAIEAEAFAYLAVRSVKGLPLSFPTTTGVPEPMTGGRRHK